MPLDVNAVGAVTVDRVAVDARWTMAYAAGLGDALDCYLDTTRADGILVHPLFPVCVEWAANNLTPSPGTERLTTTEIGQGVHAAHDLHLHRPLRPDATYELHREVIEIDQRSSGASIVVRTDATADGRAAWTSYTSTVLRDVALEGKRRRTPQYAVPDVPHADTRLVLGEAEIPVSATAAHVYSECARIWNPIHTDPKVAASAGLPGPILHGTATLALALSAIIHNCFDGDPRCVNRVAGRFSGMVPTPTILTARIYPPADGHAGVAFEVVDSAGHRVLRDGWVGSSPELAP